MTNIALIILDTLRKDTFDAHFDWMSGTRYENAWSTSHWTVPAHASLFTGQYASDVGVHARAQHLDYEDATLAESLSQADYRTRGFSTNSHITPYFNFDRGFDQFECRQQAKRHDDRLFRLSEVLQGSRADYPAQIFEALLRIGRGEYDFRASLRKIYRHMSNRYPYFPSLVGTSAEEALSYVQNTEFGSDEFLFMNLMDVHGPYKPPLRYQRRHYSETDVFAKGMATFADKSFDEGAMRDAYEDCARYLSDKLQEIINELNDFDYIITLSDHGESFGEDGVWAHIYGVHPSLTQVPLVIRGPNQTTTSRQEPVNLLDVYATIAEIAGFDAVTEGRPLRGEIPTRPCLTEYHGITHADKLDKLYEYGFSDAKIEEIDEPRFGISLPPNYYRYETLDGHATIGETEHEDPETLLNELRVERLPLDRTERELEDEIKSQLSQLGYL